MPEKEKKQYPWTKAVERIAERAAHAEKKVYAGPDFFKKRDAVKCVYAGPRPPKTELLDVYAGPPPFDPDEPAEPADPAENGESAEPVFTLDSPAGTDGSEKTGETSGETDETGPDAPPPPQPDPDPKMALGVYAGPPPAQNMMVYAGPVPRKDESDGFFMQMPVYAGPMQMQNVPAGSPGDIRRDPPVNENAANIGKEGYCASCGAKLFETSKFCHECGTPVKQP